MKTYELASEKIAGSSQTQEPMKKEEQQLFREKMNALPARAGAQPYQKGEAVSYPADGGGSSSSPVKKWRGE